MYLAIYAFIHRRKLLTEQQSGEAPGILKILLFHVRKWFEARIRGVWVNNTTRGATWQVGRNRGNVSTLRKGIIRPLIVIAHQSLTVSGMVSHVTLTAVNRIETSSVQWCTPGFILNVRIYTCAQMRIFRICLVPPWSMMSPA